MEELYESEYRHPSGVLIKAGDSFEGELPRDLSRLTDWVVTITRRTALGTFEPVECYVRYVGIERWANGANNPASDLFGVSGFNHRTGKPDIEVVRIRFADILSVEVW